MDKLIVDCETGEETVEPLTTEEESALTALAAEVEQGDAQQQTEADNREAIRSAVVDHLAALRTIRGASGTLTAAQLSNAARVLAKGQIHVIRLLVGVLDGTD